MPFYTSFLQTLLLREVLPSPLPKHKGSVKIVQVSGKVLLKYQKNIGLDLMGHYNIVFENQ